jgi:hypothetical protein
MSNRPGKASMYLHGSLCDQDTGVPTVQEAAIGLSRIPRFGGQTTVYWSVAHHLRVAMRLAALEDPQGHLPLHMALHDFHECMTMDVPTAFKTPDLKALQAKLDKRVYAALEIEEPDVDEKAAISRIDLRCLVNEARVVTPIETYRWMVQYAGFEADVDAVEAVRDVAASWPTADAIKGHYHAHLSTLLNYYYRTTRRATING